MLHVQILKTPGCAGCDTIERGWRALRPTYEGQVQVEVIDLLEDPEVAVRYGVLRTPALVIGGRLRTQGALDTRRLQAVLDEELGRSHLAQTGAGGRGGARKHVPEPGWEHGGEPHAT